MGLPKFLYASLHACHSFCQLRQPFTPSPLSGALVLPSVGVKTLGDWNIISKLYQLSGSADSPTAYMILCVRFVCFVRWEFHPLRHRRNTRYGWLAKPYPTGTFTLQDAPSFAWRDNATSNCRSELAAFLRLLAKKQPVYEGQIDWPCYIFSATVVSKSFKTI